MKHSFCVIAATAILLLTNTLFAQEQTDSVKIQKKHHELTVSNHGIRIQTIDSAKSKNGGHEHKSRFFTSVGPVDIGINILADNTNYANPSVRHYLNVPANEQNKSIFDLRQGKSVNVNIDPFMVSFRALNTNGQHIYISTGFGFQLYNFRYENPITFTKNPAGVIQDTISFKKDKLVLDYLNIPLMFTFKTRLSANSPNENKWLVYGVGITEGYLIAAWTKQESGARGKVKVHDDFGMASFNTCVSAEIGIDGAIRFFATYQLTSLYNNGLDLHPFSFGFRISGI